MKKINLKDDIWIEGFSDNNSMIEYRQSENFINRFTKKLNLIYMGKTSEIPSELALEVIPKIFEETNQEMFQSYYYHDSYSLTPKESIQSACNKEYCIIYKEK